MLKDFSSNLKWAVINQNFTVLWICLKCAVLTRIEIYYWKEMDQPLLPHTICGRENFSFSESLHSIFTSCEPNMTWLFVIYIVWYSDLMDNHTCSRHCTSYPFNAEKLQSAIDNAINQITFVASSYTEIPWNYGLKQDAQSANDVIIRFHLIWNLRE